MVAVQTQYAASLEVAVAARLQKGKPGWEVGATDVNGPLVKSWSLRCTLHVHRPEDHALILSTLGPTLVKRYERWRDRYPALVAGDMENRIVRALEAGPLRREELHAHIPEIRGLEGVGWGLDVMGLSLQGRVAVVGRGNQQMFSLRPPLDHPSDLPNLFRRYLAAYGPATMADFCFWAGITQAEAKQTLRDEVEAVIPVEISGLPGLRFDLESMPEPVDGTLGVQLLAKFDPLILAHKDKRLLLAEEDRPKVFRIAAQVEAPVLVEGRVAATWRMERRPRSLGIRVEPCRNLKVREMARIEKAAYRLGKRLGWSEVSVVFV